MLQLTLVSVLLCLMSASRAAELPSEVKLCKVSDGPCMIEAASKLLQLLAPGIKSLGVVQIEPLLIKEFLIPGNEGATINFGQTYHNVYVHGLTRLQMKSIKASISKSECFINVEAVLPHSELIGIYEAKGRMMVFTINGGGAFNVTLIDIGLKYEALCEIYDKAGASHLKVKDLKLTFDSGTPLFDYDNLVDNNPELSATIMATMNDNHQEIFRWLKADFEKVFRDVVKDITDNVFERVPVDHLFLS